MNYIRKHWQGKLSLAKSFWINFVLFSFITDRIMRTLYHCLIRNNTLIWLILFVCLFIAYAIFIYPWQIAGLWRACRFQIRKNNKRFWGRTTQTLIIMSILINSTIMLFIIADHNFVDSHLKSMGIIENELADHTLKLDKEGRILYLAGGFEFGVFQDVKDMINKHPKIEGIVFDTPGGRALEGNRLANLISQHKLNTYAINECCSAGADAFISGQKRFLIKGSVMGFHRSNRCYNEECFLRQNIIHFNRQGVKNDFIIKISSVPYDDMWYPTVEELLDAGVIHGVVDSNLNPVEPSEAYKEDKERREHLHEILKQWEENAQKE